MQRKMRRMRQKRLKLFNNLSFFLKTKRCKVSSCDLHAVVPQRWGSQALVARWESGGGQNDELNKPSDSPLRLIYLCHMRLTC